MAGIIVETVTSPLPEASAVTCSPVNERRSTGNCVERFNQNRPNHVIYRSQSQRTARTPLSLYRRSAVAARSGLNAVAGVFGGWRRHWCAAGGEQQPRTGLHQLTSEQNARPTYGNGVCELQARHGVRYGRLSLVNGEQR